MKCADGVLKRHRRAGRVVDHDNFHCKAAPRQHVEGSICRLIGITDGLAVLDLIEQTPDARIVLVDLDTKAFELRDAMNDWLLVFSTWNLFQLYVEHSNPDVRSLVKERFFNSFRLLPCLNS